MTQHNDSSMLEFVHYTNFVIIVIIIIIQMTMMMTELSVVKQTHIK